MANKPMKSIILPGLDDTYTFAQIDNTLTEAGDAADAKKVGDELTQLKADITDKADKSEALGSYVVNTASGAIASFPDGADGVPVKDLTVQIVPYQAGTGDPSPENVRPISGWTGCNIFRGKNNLWDTTPYKSIGYNTDIGTAVNLEVTTSETNINGDTITYSAGAWGGRSFRTPILKSGTYHVRFDVTSVTNARSSIYTVRDGKISDKYYSTSSSVISRDITVIDGDYIVVVVAVSSAETVTIQGYQIVSGTTGIVWEPYDGNTYSITFPTEAGTVYGGTLDVTSGVLTVDGAMVTLTGASSETWGNYSSGYGGYRLTLSDAKINGKPSEQLLSNMFVGASTRGQILEWEPWKMVTYNSAADDTMVFFTTSITDKDEWLAWLEENPTQLVYPLATPQTYQLTPTEVTTLLGLNNIWSDTGDTTVDYRADTKLYIDALTEPDSDMIADSNIDSGSYFVVNNHLYISTAVIAQGDAIVPGTNCTETNLADALNALNS